MKFKKDIKKKKEKKKSFYVLSRNQRAYTSCEKRFTALTPQIGGSRLQQSAGQNLLVGGPFLTEGQVVS